MKRYPRTPALLIVLVALSLGALYVTAWGRVEALWKKQPGEQSVEALEKRIADEQKAGSVSSATWFAYGNALGEAKRWPDAAKAYQEVLALEPARRDAKFQCALALAQAGQADEFYKFQKDLVYGEAKLAIELFERPETQKYLADERFSALAKEAKNQAMD